MTFQSPFPQSPFARPPDPPPLPEVIKPLRYCEFRIAVGQQGNYDTSHEVNLCPVFASEVIQEMYFCYMHGLVIQHALGQEQGGDDDDDS